jgi:hypothetical protein
LGVAKKGAAKKKKQVQVELSDWQLMRVRNALRAYHRYGRDTDGRYFTWRDVREAIDLYTGVQIGASLKLGAERLRQFVEGVEGKLPGEGRRFPSPQPKALKAIIGFVTHKELDLLSAEELSEDITGVQAPLRLLEYMRAQCALPESDEFRHLEGHYLTAHPAKDGWVTRSLYLQRAHDDGVLQVMEVRDHFDTASKEQALEWASEIGRALSSRKFSGWALLTPEDSLMLFMKREEDGKNHRYLCLEEVGLWLQAVPKYIEPDQAAESIKILMMEHEFGHDLQGADRDKIVDSFIGDLFIFSKLSGSAA